MATTVQIRENAAENLGILGEGETLPSYEADDLDRAYVEVHSEMLSNGKANWGVTDNIPDKYVRSVAMKVAEARAVKYKIPFERYQQIKLEAEEADRMIDKLQASEQVGVTRMQAF